MAEYDITFGKRLAETARMVASEGIAELDAQRTVLYLSLLSTEITLKAMLEQAGMPVSEIRAHSHRLAALLSSLGLRKIEIEIAPGAKRHVLASRIRAIQINHGSARSTVGDVIDAESHGASKYQIKCDMENSCIITLPKSLLKWPLRYLYLRISIGKIFVNKILRGATMWWKIGIGLFLLMAFIAGGELGQIFIGAPLGVMLVVGAFIIHEKMFKPNPMKELSFFETLTLGVMVLGAVLLTFWLIMTLFG